MFLGTNMNALYYFKVFAFPRLKKFLMLTYHALVRNAVI